MATILGYNCNFLCPRRLFWVTQRGENWRGFFCGISNLWSDSIWRVWSSVSNLPSQFRKVWLNIINYYKFIMNVIILSLFYLSPLFAFDSAILNFEIQIPVSWSATPKTYGNTIDTHCKSSTKMYPSKG